MKKSMLLGIIGDTIENKVIDFLIEGIGIDYSKKDIANNCDISRSTLYKILPNLVKSKLVKATRVIGRSQLYSLNTENDRVKALLKLEEFLLTRSFKEIEIKPRIKI